MTDTTKTEALRLAELLEQGYDGMTYVLLPSADELRRLSAVEAERDQLLQLLSYECQRLNGALDARIAERDRLAERLDRAIRAAEEHFGEDAIRHKLSLFKNGRARNVFPQQMDGQWFSFQRADNDAHVGLALRCAEAEQDRDRLAAECQALRADARRYVWLHENRCKYIWNHVMHREETDGHNALDAAIDAAMGGKESKGGQP